MKTRIYAAPAVKGLRVYVQYSVGVIAVYLHYPERLTPGVVKDFQRFLLNW